MTRRIASILVLVVACHWTTSGAPRAETETSGVLLVTRGERFDSGAHDIRYDFALACDDGSIVPFVPGGSIAADTLAALSGRRVTVARGGEVRETPLLRKTAVTATTASVDDPASRGTHPFLTILCRFADTTDVTPFQPETASHFFTDFGQRTLPDYWREVSYGAVDLSGSRVVGWVNLSKRHDAYVRDINGDGDLDFLSQQAFDDALAATGQGEAVTDYFGVCVIFNEEPLEGLAWQSDVKLGTGPELRTIPATFTGPIGLARPSVYAHETGHALGLPHSSGPYSDPYDSHWDTMSAGASVHTNAFHKDLAGWIPETRRAIFRDEGSQTATIAPLSDPSASGALIGIVPVDDEGKRFYTIEARRRTGYDFFVPTDGVVLHLVDLKRGDRIAQVVDATMDADPDDDGAVWTVGERFTDAPGGVFITIDAAEADGYRVTVGRVRPLATTCFAEVPANHWKGEYFATFRMFGAVAVRDEGAGVLAPSWGAGGPSTACGVGNSFSARWTRDIALAEGVHQIAITVAGGARLRMDGRTVFDTLSAPTSLESYSVNVALAAGVHRVEVAFRDLIETPRISIRIDPPRPGFRLEIDDAPRAIAPGAVAPFAVRVVGLGGFRSPVTISAEPEPGLSGGSIRLDRNVVGPGESTGATLAIDDGAPSGMLAVRIEGRAGTLVVACRLLVRTRLGFVISCVPDAIDTRYGTRGDISIVIDRDDGMTAPVDVRLTAGTPSFLKLKPSQATTSGNRIAIRYKVKKTKRPISYRTDITCVGTSADGTSVLATLRFAVR